jgi:hypothetical protein
LYFGTELLKTQHEGITAITRIETYEMQQTQDLTAVRLQLQQVREQLALLQQQHQPQ